MMLSFQATLANPFLICYLSFVMICTVKFEFSNTKL
uniref:Uncharacterized protein n=1 Tax=Rhizophora mucronata TaxID=61149 RepID=A0A2P2KIP5_RHIMU